MDGLRGYCNKWNKLEKKQILYDFTCMQDMKDKQVNKHNEIEKHKEQT